MSAIGHLRGRRSGRRCRRAIGLRTVFDIYAERAWQTPQGRGAARRLAPCGSVMGRPVIDHTMATVRSDTIFAPATAPGRAALAIVRLSGPSAGDVCRRLTGRPPPAPRRAALRRMHDPHSREALDQGLVLWFPAPRQLHRRGRARAAGSWRSGSGRGAARCPVGHARSAPGRTGRVHAARIPERPPRSDRGGGPGRSGRRRDPGAGAPGAAPARWRAGPALWWLARGAARRAGPARGRDRLRARGGRARPAARDRATGRPPSVCRNRRAPGGWPSRRAAARGAYGRGASGRRMPASRAWSTGSPGATWRS